MVGRWTLLVLALYLVFMVVLSDSSCPTGFYLKDNKCFDENECDVDPGDEGPCGSNAVCLNAHGSFSCQCNEGFRTRERTVTFSADSSASCRDINECLENKHICGPNAVCSNKVGNYSCSCMMGFKSSNHLNNKNITCTDINECEAGSVCGQNAACINTLGSYQCVCKPGFRIKSPQTEFSGNQEPCEDICMIDTTICGNGTCHRGASGHYCACHAGFTNYGNKESRCTALNCDEFKDMNDLKEKSHISRELMVQLKSSCVELTESENPTDLDGEDLLKKLLAVIDEILFSGSLHDNRKVSTFLDAVEIILKLIGPFNKPPGTKKASTHGDLELLIHKGAVLPQGAVTLSTKHAQLEIQLETAAGEPSHYPGFATVSLLSYANLEDYADDFFSGMIKEEGQTYKINSKIVTVTVSNRDTSHLSEPVKLTFNHLKETEENHTCVFWNSSEAGGTWSANGCDMVLEESNRTHTVCSCHHLSSFAVLMALYEMEERLELQLITWVGLSLSLICLFICILTFSLIRSIQSPRTTIHLNLCISLFIATVVFLAGISRTGNPVGCAVVAGLLHFFYLAAFCWMCLEGIQLFRMVVLVFNTTFKPLYMMAGGYGVPAVIVTLTALVNAKGYGTSRYCWLSLQSIWSFFGPACVIIIINIFFFLITVWKLAQKFSSLNPDLDNLQKIK